MEAVEPEPLDQAVTRSQDWLASIAAHLGQHGPRAAYRALRSVLHLVREHLPIAASAAFGGRLPLLIRGLYFEGWQPHASKPRVRHIEEFLGLIERDLNAQGERALDPHRALLAVFERVAAQLGPDETRALVRALPPGLRLLVDAEACARVL